MKDEEDFEHGYGTLGVLSKEEAYWEELVDMCKECSTLEAIGKLRKAFETKYYSVEYQKTPGQD
jgi:hypothetical protein